MTDPLLERLLAQVSRAHEHAHAHGDGWVPVSALPTGADLRELGAGRDEATRLRGELRRLLAQIDTILRGGPDG